MPDGTQELEKRGPGRPYPPALTPEDAPAVLARYLSDESTESIGKDYGVTRQAIGQFLLKADTDGWKAAQIARAIASKEEADDDYKALKARIDAFRAIENKDERQAEIEACRLQLSLAQARAKRAEWELERLMARLYGQKVENTGPGGGPLQAVRVEIVFVSASQDSGREPIDVNPTSIEQSR